MPTKIVADVPIDAGDYDALLREALRAALRIDTDENEENFDDLANRIHELIDAYIHSPEGTDQAGLPLPTSMLMCRLAICVIDVIPLAQRCRAVAH